MRKIAAAALAGLVLVAGQASAAGVQSQTVRIGDRVGAKAETANELWGIPTVIWIGLVLGAVVVVAANEEDEDEPASA